MLHFVNITISNVLIDVTNIGRRGNCAMHGINKNGSYIIVCETLGCLSDGDSVSS